MACVYKAKRKKVISYYSDYTDATGKRIRMKLAKTRAEAEHVLAGLIQSARERDILGTVPLERILFDDLSEKFLNVKAKENMSPKSLKRLKLSFRYLKEAFGGIEVTKINHVLVGRYKEQRSQLVAGATVNRELAGLSHMFNKAIEWGYARDNPVSLVKKFPEHYNKDRSMPSAKLQVLVDVSPPYMQAIILFTLCTALRQSEILSLQWSMLDDELMVKERKWHVSLSAPLSEMAKMVLAKVPRYPGCDYVFPDEKGQPFVYYANGELFIRRTFHWRWRQVTKKAGLEKFRFHDLRHTAGSWLARLGCNSFQIMGIMGLKSIRTAERYVHLSGADLVKSSNQLSEYITGLMTKNTGAGETKCHLLEPVTSTCEPNQTGISRGNLDERLENHGTFSPRFSVPKMTN